MSVRRLAVFALCAVLVPLAACTAPPAGGDSWISAGCLDGAGQDSNAPDLRFSGVANSRGNAVISAVFVNGELELSNNGTCSGLPIAATTIVRAADEATATALCASRGAGEEPATSYTGSPWNLPEDAWACSETYFL